MAEGVNPPGSDYTPPDSGNGNKCPRRLLGMCGPGGRCCGGIPSQCSIFLGNIPAYDGIATNKGTPRDLGDQTTHRIFYLDDPFGNSVIGQRLAAEALEAEARRF